MLKNLSLMQWPQAMTIDIRIFMQVVIIEKINLYKPSAKSYMKRNLPKHLRLKKVSKNKDLRFHLKRQNYFSSSVNSCLLTSTLQITTSREISLSKKEKRRLLKRDISCHCKHSGNQSSSMSISNMRSSVRLMASASRSPGNTRQT